MVKEEQILKKELKATLFLAKSLDDFENYYEPGVDYRIIANRSSEEVLSKYPRAYVHEAITKVRSFSTSKFFAKDLFKLDFFNINLHKYKNIWTYQAYEWTDDFHMVNKKIFTIPYYLYQTLNNKLTLNTLIEHHKKKLSHQDKKFLGDKLSLINKNFKATIQLKLFNKYEHIIKRVGFPFVLSASKSNGGEHVYKIDNITDYIEAITEINSPVIKITRFLPKAISLSQIAVVLNNGEIIKYQPWLQLIKNIRKRNNFEYMGADFCLENIFKEKTKMVGEDITLYSHVIGKLLYQMGYRGIFGCDYLYNNKEIYLVEINPRYQASTFLLNRVAWKKSLLLAPHSMHILAFYKDNDFNYKTIKKNFSRTKYIQLLDENDYNAFVFSMVDGVNVRKPMHGVKIEKTVWKGYSFYKKPIIQSPYFPTTLDEDVEKTVHSIY